MIISHKWEIVGLWLDERRIIWEYIMPKMQLIKNLQVWQDADMSNMLIHREVKKSDFMQVKCCNRPMKKNLETARFIEMQCPHCGDIIYFKKERSQKPVMIDD